MKNKIIKIIFFLVILLIVSFIYLIISKKISFEKTPGIELIYSSNKTISSYISNKAKLKFEFDQPVYLIEEFEKANEWLPDNGYIKIAFNKEDLNDQKDYNYLLINYSLPKFNMHDPPVCIDENLKSLEKAMTVASKKVMVCDIDNFFASHYFSNPNKTIEYQIFIHGKKIPTKEFNIYRNIVYKDMNFSE